MIVEKARLIELLRDRGLDARADWVDRQLPDEVDTVRNASLLDTLRLTATDVLSLAGAPDTEPS